MPPDAFACQREAKARFAYALLRATLTGKGGGISSPRDVLGGVAVFDGGVSATDAGKSATNGSYHETSAGGAPNEGDALSPKREAGRKSDLPTIWLRDYCKGSDPRSAPPPG